MNTELLNLFFESNSTSIALWAAAFITVLYLKIREHSVSKRD